jgi:hypothetical protein
MENTIIIGSEKAIKPSSVWWDLSVAVGAVSAYESNSKTTGKSGYFIESCTVINSKTGLIIKNENILKGILGLEEDNLYDDITRFIVTESSINEFHNTFSGHNLEGSEFAVALSAHISEQTGYNPWLVVQPNE